MHTTRVLATAILLAALSVVCGRGSVPNLDGAMAAIPVFAPARLLERNTAHTNDQIGNPQKFSTYIWQLDTEKSAAEVVSFYMTQWPGAGRVEDDDEIHLRNPPLPEQETTPLGESVSVSITRAQLGGRTQFTITEDVFSERRR